LASTLNIPSAHLLGQEKFAQPPEIASNIAALAAGIQKLHPLLSKAEHLRAQRKHLQPQDGVTHAYPPNSLNPFNVSD
jgi:hypothetical protein